MVNRTSTPLSAAIDAGRAATAALEELDGAEARVQHASAPGELPEKQLVDIAAMPTFQRISALRPLRVRAGKALVDFAEAIIGLGIDGWRAELATLARVHIGLANGLRLVHDEERLPAILAVLEARGESVEDDAAPLSAHPRDTSLPPPPA